MGINGLAEGFLSGFQTVDNYERGKKADERMEKDASMREAMYQDSKKQQEYQNKNYEDDKAYGREQDRLNRERQNRLDAENAAERRAAAADRRASNARAARMESRQAQQFEWQREAFEQNKFLTDRMPIIQKGWADIAAGKTPGNEFWETVKNPYAAQYNPERYADESYLKAGENFVTHVSGLMKEAEAGKLDWKSKEGIDRINEPGFIKSADTIFRDEIKTGIGEPDHESGKIIKAKELHNIRVNDEGTGIVLGVKVTYADGSTAIKPVTENRTSITDDMPRVIPLTDFMGNGYRRAALSKSLQDDANALRVSLNLSEGADVKGYRRAVVDIRADTAKRIDQINTNPQIVDPAEKERLIQAEMVRENTALKELEVTFGLVQPQQEKGSPLSPLAQWAGDDQYKQSFIAESYQSGKQLPPDSQPERLEMAYQQWMQQKKSAAQVQAARNSDAEKLQSAMKQGQVNPYSDHQLKAQAEPPKLQPGGASAYGFGMRGMVQR